MDWEILGLQKSGVLALGIPHSRRAPAATPGRERSEFTSAPLPAQPAAARCPPLPRRAPIPGWPLRRGSPAGPAPASGVPPPRLLPPPASWTRPRPPPPSSAGGEGAEARPRPPHLGPPLPAPRAAGLAPGDGGASRPRSARGTRGAGGRGRRAARPAARLPCGTAAAAAWAQALAPGAQLPARPGPLPARGRRGRPLARRNLPRTLCEQRRRRRAPGPGGSGARRTGARRDASGRRPPSAAPRRAAPQPVPPARVPGPLPHRAGARGHADGARMPHRGRQLRRAGAHHLGPRPPLLPLLGRLLGECPRPGGDGAARAGHSANLGARTPGAELLQRGVRFKTPGSVTPGPYLPLSQHRSPFPIALLPGVTFLGGNKLDVRRARRGPGDSRLVRG